jgi:hypothetical protein
MKILSSRNNYSTEKKITQGKRVRESYLNHIRLEGLNTSE